MSVVHRNQAAQLVCRKFLPITNMANSKERRVNCGRGIRANRTFQAARNDGHARAFDVYARSIVAWSISLKRNSGHRVAIERPRLQAQLRHEDHHHQRSQAELKTGDGGHGRSLPRRPRGCTAGYWAGAGRENRRVGVIGNGRRPICALVAWVNRPGAV